VRNARFRVLVTGSRGKSSLVRLLCAGIEAKGLVVRGRITGVLPREISHSCERLIIRNSPAHIGEMRWWLRQIPYESEAVVMENSAVHTELQPMAAKWLKPTTVVWTNARPDHQEVWGISQEAAEHAILRGIPDGVPLIVGGEAARSPQISRFLEARKAPVLVAPYFEWNYRLSNLSLARKTLEFCGLLDEKSSKAMEFLPPDIGDFRVFYFPGGARLAAAFSANDVVSTEHLFALLDWKEEETSLYFSDREDRPYRRAGFEHFLKRGWLEVCVQKKSVGVGQIEEFIRGKQVFGCGNIAGAPLELLRKLTEEKYQWTIPGA